MSGADLGDWRPVRVTLGGEVDACGLCGYPFDPFDVAWTFEELEGGGPDFCCRRCALDWQRAEAGRPVDTPAGDAPEWGSAAWCETHGDDLGESPDY